MATHHNPLKFKRIGAGMTQAALASAAGISQQLMSKLESGLIDLKPERAQEFAKILGCSAIELLPAFQTDPATEQQEVEMLRIYRDLDPSNQDMLVQFARTLHATTIENKLTERAASR